MTIVRPPVIMLTIEPVIMPVMPNIPTLIMLFVLLMAMIIVISDIKKGF